MTNLYSALEWNFFSPGVSWELNIEFKKAYQQLKKF